MITFDNPVETFLNKILSDAKSQSAAESQILEEKSELLDIMNETVVMNNTLLAQVKDIACNVRMEVKEIQPLKESVEKLQTELSRLERGIGESEENTRHPNRCPICGKPILLEFKVCPYCGENIRLLPKTVIALRNFR